MRLRDELAAHNERVKLRANTVNAIAIGLIGFGLLRPLTSEPEALTWISGLWSMVGVAIHLMAGYILGGMRRKGDDDDL